MPVVAPAWSGSYVVTSPVAGIPYLQCNVEASCAQLRVGHLRWACRFVRAAGRPGRLVKSGSQRVLMQGEEWVLRTQWGSSLSPSDNWFVGSLAVLGRCAA